MRRLHVKGGISSTPMPPFTKPNRYKFSPYLDIWDYINSDKVFFLDKTITDFHFSLKAICNSAKRVCIIFLNYFIQYFPIR